MCTAAATAFAQSNGDSGPIARAEPIAIDFLKAVAAQGKCIIETAKKDATGYGKSVAAGDVADAVLSECEEYILKADELEETFEHTLYSQDGARADNNARQANLDRAQLSRGQAISIVLKTRVTAVGNSARRASLKSAESISVPLDGTGEDHAPQSQP
jgi:hypothetical protein